MRSRTYRLWLFICLLTLLSGACTISFGGGQPTVETPTETPAAALPTRTPKPTPTAKPDIGPLPLPAPRLLERVPAPGAAQPLAAPIELTFDQPMDQKSVEAAFTISPTIEGKLAWLDARTLQFVADAPLERGGMYQVAVAATARNAEGELLEAPVTFDFSAQGFLQVVEVQPAPDTTELAADARVTVIFNRPVVPLTALEAQAALPQPLTFTPAVKGVGEWLNTSIYVFRPAEGFLPATRYTAQVAADFEDTTGGVLAAPYEWTFTTLRPAVSVSDPYPGFAYVGPGAAISITFNQPMDHATTEAAFALTVNGATQPGAFRWAGGATSFAPETLVFTPATALPRGAFCQVAVAGSAKPARGALALENAWVMDFSVAPAPALLQTEPADRATGVDVYDDVRLTFASPMQIAGFLSHLRITPAPTEVYTYWSEVDRIVNLSFDKSPQTDYRIQLDTTTPDKFGAVLGQAVDLRFTTGNLPPVAELQSPDRLNFYSTYTDTVMYSLVRNVRQLDFALYTLTPDEFMSLNGYGDWDAWDKFTPAAGRLIRRWAQPVSSALNADTLFPVQLLDAAGRPLPSGLYYLEMLAPDVLAYNPETRPARLMFVKSGYNLTLKQTRTESLVWGVELATGKPAAGLPIRFNSQSAGWHGAGRTDVNGLWLARGVEQASLWDAYFAFAGEPGDPSFAVAYNGWSEGITPWQFNLYADYDSYGYKTNLYTDRPIYRPGQTVYFKGIARLDDDARYALLTEGMTLTVSIDDPQGKQVYLGEIALNDIGTFNGEFLLGPEAPLGYYYIAANRYDVNLYSSAGFQVAEYRKPEYEVAVTTARPAYLAGDDVAVSAEATYYFGGPVADAAVHWSALSAAYFFSYVCPPGLQCPYYNWTDYDWTRDEDAWMYDGYGSLVAEGDAVTDAQGRVTFETPADIAGKTQSQVFTLEASVTDINGQQVSNRATAIVHQGAYYIGLAARGYLAQVNKAKQVDVLTVDWDSAPVASGPLTVTFLEQRWYSARQLSDNGYYYWEWTVEEIPVFTTTVTTGADGKAVAEFIPPRAGSYKVRALGRDAQGNTIRSAAYVWVWGGAAYWRQQNNNRIELVADRDSYAVGDVAEILIPSPYSGTVQALVTVERGHILWSGVRALASNSEVLRIPIEAGYAPNVFVSVVIMQGAAAGAAAGGMASFKMGMINLPISVAEKELTITLTPDKNMALGEFYKPRHKAVYNVLVTDHAGKPVEAELSLRLADLAVLALADESAPSLLSTFWSERGVAIRTSLPLVVAMEPYNRDLAPGGKGGGGGLDTAAGLVRKNFADTAFWDPVVRTDANGKAQVEVELPDNLTTWRMQAKGVTADTLVGQAEVDIRTSLDLLVRPILPRFFVVGDRAEIGAVVHNNTPNALKVDVRMTPVGLVMDDSGVQAVEIPAGDKVKVVWGVSVMPDEASVSVRLEAQGPGDYFDAREDTLPVYRYSTPEVVGAAGRLSEPGLRQEIVQLPRVFDPTQGELTVQVDGSLTAATQDALSYLEHYPYECTEQTVSRFLPNVLTYRALTELEGDGAASRPELRAKLETLVSVALQKLYNNQHYDGGWGWWVSDESNPYITAYVLQGMLEAHRAGFTVDRGALDRGATYLLENLPPLAAQMSSWAANRLAYELYVLGDYADVFGADAAQGALGRAVRLFEQRARLDQYGRALLAAALHLLEPQEPTRVNTLLGDLAGDAILSAAGTHWEEAAPDYWNMNTDIRTTATVIWAIARIHPESEQLPNAVRWLMAARREGYWETTQATSWALMALTEYMHVSGELQGDFNYTIYLNGFIWEKGDVTPETIEASLVLRREIAELLRDEGNRLVIERHDPAGNQTGAGQLYYTAYLRYFLPAEEVKALDRGINVARRYTPLDDANVSVTTAQVGDVIRVKLTIVAPTDLYYVVVEDPFPAGFEAVDLSLKTTSVVGERPLLQAAGTEEDAWYRWYGWGWWWFSHTELRDEKAVLFASYLPRGAYEYTYLLRASVPGEYRAMPAAAYQMYFPDVFGRSDGGVFVIGE